MSYELYIPRTITVNPINGQFLKGHVPHNKGKRWEDYMDMRKARRIKKNLEIGQRKGNPSLGGWNARAIVAIKDGRLCGVFSSSNDAERKTKICARNIRSVCSGKRKRAGGYEWYYENDNRWIELIKC